MCRSSINMYGMLYIKTDSTRFDSTQLDSCRAKTNFEKCQKKTQQNKNKRKSPCSKDKRARNEEGTSSTQLKMEQEKDICAACLPAWMGWTRRRASLKAGDACGIVGCSFARAPTQTDRQQAAAAAAPATATVPAGVHGSNITQQNAIKHFVATRSCEQQMLIKGVCSGVADKGGMWAASFVGLSTHTNTHTT